MHPPKRRVTPGIFRSIRALFAILLTLTRVGEAKVPGPAENTWTLGICNPSGLQGKHHVLGSVATDIMAISETHLTKHATTALRTHFRSPQTRFKHVLTGAPVTQRTSASNAGLYSGVAFAPTFPCRTIATAWPPDLYETGRLQFGAFFAQGTWVTGAVAYGYPEGRTHLNAHQKTTNMLDFAFQRLSMQPGPRFFAGDWNFAIDTLDIVPQLRAARWVEAQDHFLALTGAPIQLTCKQATRKDFLWISPELARGFLDLHIHHDVFADHSVLLATFVGGSSHLERFVWPCPKPVSWAQAQPLSAEVDFCSPLDPTEQYAQLWSQKEAVAQASLPHLWHSSMQGRGQQTKPLRIVGSQAPIKQGRSHDVQPAFFGLSALHAKQFKQLRRLQNYCRWVDNRVLGLGSDVLHGVCLWNSILRAPGFAPTFSAWWPTRLYVSPLDPDNMPQHGPCSAVAHQIYEAVLAEVRLFEQRLIQAKAAHRASCHEQDRQLVFRDVARTPAEPVETLLHKVEAKIIEVDDDETAVVLDKPVELKPQQPIWISGKAHDVIHADHDKVWLEDVAQIDVDSTAVQANHVGDLQTILEAFS